MAADLAYPRTPDDVDAGWLTEALRERHPGVHVREVEVIERHEVTNLHARLRVTYVDPAGAPATMFCKLPPLDDRREAILATGMGQREARFYRTLAPSLTLRVPAAPVARQDDDRGLFVILMEDLTATGCSVSDGIVGVAPDSAARALEELAELHARFADPARRLAVAPWVPVLPPGGSYGKDMLRYGIDHHRDRLTDAFVEIAEIYIDRAPVLHARWQHGPKTIIHGDPHIGNLFDDHGRTGFLDWGIINVGTPMRDVSYFMTMGMSIDDRRAHERDLLRHYLAALDAHGGPVLPFDDAWLAHRIQAAYTVPASCQVVMFPADMSPRRRVFSDAFLERAQACLDDLDTIAILHDLGV